MVEIIARQQINESHLDRESRHTQFMKQITHIRFNC